MRFRHALIRYATPTIWRLSSQRKLAALQEFANTELDSGWQSMYAMQFMPDPEVRGALFRHAMEEFYHSDCFLGLVQSYADAPLNTAVFSRQAIWNAADKDSILDFLVKVHVGEKEINEDFVEYARADLDVEIRRLFSLIKEDEEGHEDSSYKMLLQAAGGDRFQLKRRMWMQSVSNGYKRYKAWAQAMGEVSMGILLSGIYFLTGPFFTLSFRSRMALDRESQLQILREQTKTIVLEKNK